VTRTPIIAGLCNQVYRSSYRRSLMAQTLILFTGIGLLGVTITNYILLPTGWQIPIVDPPISGVISIAIIFVTLLDMASTRRMFNLTCP
jgi:hypothetical protein